MPRFIHPKKKLLIVGFVLIIIGFAIITYNKLIEYRDIKKHTSIIDRDFYNGDSNKYDNLNYLIIPDLNVKRIIKDNSSDDILNQYYVGLVSGDLNSSLGNIVLAGHNVKQVFNSLHHINIGTEIILKAHTKETFIVDNKYEILKNDSSVLKTITDSKQLTLITCTNDKNYRLIVTAKKSRV